MISRYVFTESYRELVSFFADAGELDTSMELTDDQLTTCLEQYPEIFKEVCSEVPDQVVRILSTAAAIRSPLVTRLRFDIARIAVHCLAVDVEQELAERDLDDDRPPQLRRFNGPRVSGEM